MIKFKILIAFTLTFLFIIDKPLIAQYTKSWQTNSNQILKTLLKGELDYFKNTPTIDTFLLNYANSDLKNKYDQLKETVAKLTNTSQTRAITKINYDSLSPKEAKKIEKANLENTLQNSIRNNSMIDALEKLVSKPFLYDSLKNYSNILIPIYNKYLYSDKRSGDYVFIGFSLLNIPISIKKILLEDPNTPYFVKAKLGDVNAIDKFQKKFNEIVSDTVYNKNLELLLNQLFYINSKTLWDSFLFHLQRRYSQKYYYTNDDNKKCYREWSIAYLFLKEYKKYFPYELEYFERSIIGNPRIPDEQEISIYFLAVSKYLSIKFNQNINIKSYYLGRGDIL